MRRTTRLRQTSLLAASLLFVVSWAHAQQYGGSSDPKERADRMVGFLERMDRDRDGRLERDEISDRARGFVDRMLREAGLNPSQSIVLKDLRNRLLAQFERQASSSTPAPPSSGPMGFGDPDRAVPGFGQVENQPPIPGFGEGGPGMVRVEKEDLDKAADRLRRYDRNRDGHMDREEAKAGKWYDDPFQWDANRDNRLSQQELAQRYAVRRVAEAGGQSGSANASPRPQPGQGPGGEDQRADPRNQPRRQPTAAEREAWSLADSMMGRYDVNRNRALDPPEWGDLPFKSSSVDTNGDDRIDRNELARWLLRRAEQSGLRLPEGLPDWFARSDLNGDGQIVMSEFAEEWTEERAEEFVRHDRNGDGVIVPEECLSGSNLPGGTYVNHEMQIIPARGTVYSEIVVSDDDDEPISDLDVQLSITHTHDDYLDVFLLGPEGERVELFTGVGGHDDHFSNTILDDESSWPIVRARPPFSGRYRPEGALKNQPSLSQFYGRNITGTWTLVVQAARSERPGALHGWSLIAKREARDSEKKPDWEDGAPREPGYGRPPDGRRTPSGGRPDEREDDAPWWMRRR